MTPDATRTAREHEPVPFYRGQPTPNKSNHRTGVLPYCRVCRKTLTPYVFRTPCLGKPESRP